MIHQQTKTVVDKSSPLSLLNWSSANAFKISFFVVPHTIRILCNKYFFISPAVPAANKIGVTQMFTGAQRLRWTPLFTVAWKPVHMGWCINICSLSVPIHEYNSENAFSSSINMSHLFKTNHVLFDRAVQIFHTCITLLKYVLIFYLWHLIDKKRNRFHLRLSISLSFSRYIFAQGHYSSKTVSQPGWKKSSGEMRWLCSVRQKSSLLPVSTFNPFFLSYLKRNLKSSAQN